MSIVSDFLSRKNKEISTEIDKLFEKLMQIQPVNLQPISASTEYSLKDFKENERVLKIRDTKQKPIALLIDKNDLPLSKRLCYLGDINVKSNFSYIYNVDVNLKNQKDYRLISISEFEKAHQISTVIQQCVNTFENKEEEKILRDLQLYARNCVAESVMKNAIKLLYVCGRKNDVYVDERNTLFCYRLLKELDADYSELPLSKFISKYEQKHNKMVAKCFPAAYDFLSTQIQTVGLNTSTPENADSFNMTEEQPQAIPQTDETQQLVDNQNPFMASINVGEESINAEAQPDAENSGNTDIQANTPEESADNPDDTANNPDDTANNTDETTNTDEEKLTDEKYSSMLKKIKRRAKKSETEATNEGTSTENEEPTTDNSENTNTPEEKVM